MIGGARPGLPPQGDSVDRHPWIYWYPPLRSWRSDLCEEGYLHLLWTVPWRNCTPLDGVHPQSRNCQTDSATVQGHPVHSSVWDPGGINNGNNISSRLLLMQCFTLPQRNKAEAYQGTNHALLSISNPQATLACKVTGQAPHKLAPCPLWKHWALPGWWMQSNLGAHSQAHEIASQHMCPFCVTRVWNKLSKSVDLQDPLSYLQTSRQSSIGKFALPTPSQRGISKPSGECWNHCQSTKKLEVKLTQRKLRCFPDGQSQLYGAMT